MKYMTGKKNLAAYYALLCMLSVGSVGVFLTSNLILFYFCWELMLIPAYFIVGEWGSNGSYRSAFKLFIYTHVGAVFVLLGIGATYIATGTTDMFQAQTALLTASPTIVKWILIALTAGFAVKMAVIPVHMWLPDSYSDAPSPMSALLGGVLSSAGAYALLRLSLGMVFPSVGLSFGTDFLYALSIIGVLSAFFGSFMALVSKDIKRLIAYSSISHMGYIMFGFSLFPVAAADGTGTAVLLASAIAISGTVLHIITHALSKGLLFLSAGGVETQTEERDIGKMGGLASKMPFTAVSTTIAALSIGGVPPFACFISEFLIFVGAFQIINGSLSSFYVVPTALMLVATVLSLAYMLRFTSFVFLGPPKQEQAETNGEPKNPRKIGEVSNYMKLSFAILVVLVVLIGIYPTMFLNLIQTVRIG
jgi:NADH-quinone oxidoreductase subunit M